MTAASGAAPRLAAVILNYRTPHEAVRSARALRNSGRPVQDLIVVDNASCDGSMDILRAELPDAVLVETRANLGFSGGCNAGIEEALKRGAGLVLLVNSDLVLVPEAIGLLEAALAGRPAAGIAGPMVLVAADPGRIESMGMSFAATTGRVRHHRVGERAESYAGPETSEVDGISGCAMLVRRDVFARIGLFAEEYFFSFEDLDFCLRARRAGFLTVCASRARAYHEGGRSIGARSARRLYFATRNHLLLVDRLSPGASGIGKALRGGGIVLHGLLHAVLRADAPMLAGVASVLRGMWHHLMGRYGTGQ